MHAVRIQLQVKKKSLKNIRIYIYICIYIYIKTVSILYMVHTHAVFQTTFKKCLKSPPGGPFGSQSSYHNRTVPGWRVSCNEHVESGAHRS